MTWKLSEIAKMCSGTLIGNDLAVENLNTDSRTSITNSVFLALKGKNFNGHNFLEDAVSSGALGLIIEKDFYQKNKDQITNKNSIILVDDTHEALCQWAENWRQHFQGKVIAISGSNGKTTTKEMLVRILSDYFGKNQIHFTPKNLNNHIGVPLTLLSIRDIHQIAVIEIGINHQGEMSKLAKIVNPDIALITNAGVAHLSGLGTVSEVANEKANLYQFIKNNGIAIINQDDQHKVVFENFANGHKKKYFGYKNCHSQITNELYKLNISTNYLAEKINFSINSPATHLGINALAVLAIAEEFQIPAKTVCSVFPNLTHIPGRMQVIENSQIKIINDAYNANPDSMKAAIDTLKILPTPRVLIMGDMAEIDPDSTNYHQQIIKYAINTKIEAIILLGKEFNQAFNSLNLDQNNIYLCISITHAEKVFNKLKDQFLKKYQKINCLIKASRFMQLEQIIPNIMPGEYQTKVEELH